MEPKPRASAASAPATPRFSLGKQSSMAPDRGGGGNGVAEGSGEAAGVANFQLMYMAHEGNAAGIRELLDAGADPNFRDSDGRTAMHISACEGHAEVVEMLLDRGAEAVVEDQWGSTPLADAMHYHNHDVIKILEKHGSASKHQVAPMHVNSDREVPEYEIDPNELEFTSGKGLSKGTFRKAMWRGILVAVKKLDDDVLTDESKVQAFRDELDVLQLIRHPNVVQFLGAVTQTNPMMIVMEFMPKILEA